MVRQAVTKWLRRTFAELSTTRTVVHGIPVVVVNTRPDVQTSEVLARLERVLGLIEAATPHYYRHLKRDFKCIRVERYACRGAYFYGDRACLVELTFSVNPNFSDPEVAATVIHEAMHARLHAIGVPLERRDRARHERFCRRAEVEFGQAVPGGEPVVERAMAILEEADDEEVAPVMDDRLAAERILQADVEASKFPAWYKQAVAKRRRWAELPTD